MSLAPSQQQMMSVVTRELPGRADAPPGEKPPRMGLDWKALQRALVFTKLVYRKPAVEKPRKAEREGRDVPTAEAVAAVAAAVVSPPAPRAAATRDAANGKKAFDPYGEVDERLLPWSWD